jgi:integrase
VNRPHGRARDLPVIEPDLARQILATVRDVAPWDAAVHLALGLSLRREEVLGLGWSDVDLEAGVVSVRRTLTADDEGLHYGPPKSAAGERDLEAPGFVIAALRRHRKSQAKRRLLLGADWPLAGIVDDLVVERGGGEPWHPATFSTYWRRFAIASGFDGITFHGLRHGTGALLLDAGIDDTVALAIMGHSATTMLRHYQGVSKTLMRRAADRLDEILGDG